MTTTPGDGDRPDDSSEPPPGYWEQQAQGAHGHIPYPQQPHGGEPGPYGGQHQDPYAGQPQQPGQPGYGYGYGPPPVQYAPDHPRATTSLILGILGIVLCQVLGPFAWWIGKRTVDEIDASQGRLGGRGSAQAGYIMGIIGTVLLAFGLIALVVWIILAVALFSTSSTG